MEAIKEIDDSSLNDSAKDYFNELALNFKIENENINAFEKDLKEEIFKTNAKKEKIEAFIKKLNKVISNLEAKDKNLILNPQIKKEQNNKILKETNTNNNTNNTNDSSNNTLQVLKVNDVNFSLINKISLLTLNQTLTLKVDKEIEVIIFNQDFSFF